MRVVTDVKLGDVVFEIDGWFDPSDESLSISTVTLGGHDITDALSGATIQQLEDAALAGRKSN